MPELYIATITRQPGPPKISNSLYLNRISLFGNFPASDVADNCTCPKLVEYIAI